MPTNATTLLHKRRLGRNVGVALCLVFLVVLLTGLTLVKMVKTGPIEGYDHTRTPAYVEEGS